MKDYLSLHLQDLPYFRALLRAIEARFYKDIHLSGPVLDLGCGDGHFASLTFDNPVDMGVDPWWEPIWKAAGQDSYKHLVCADGHHLPYPDGSFASGISNSVLEHIPDLDPVIGEMARVLEPGALFIFCVPNHRFLDSLSIGSWLEKAGFSRLADKYRDFFNMISRHYHCDPHPVWEKRLNDHGFVIESWWDYFSPSALKVLEWGHYFGLPSWVCKILFGRWILIPGDWNLLFTDRLVRPHYEGDPRHPKGVYSFYKTRLAG